MASVSHSTCPVNEYWAGVGSDGEGTCGAEGAVNDFDPSHPAKAIVQTIAIGSPRPNIREKHSDGSAGRRIGFCYCKGPAGAVPRQNGPVSREMADLRYESL